MKTEQRLAKLISGAIRSTIDAHGPIGHVQIGSATKRIMAAIQSSGIASMAFQAELAQSNLGGAVTPGEVSPCQTPEKR